MGYILPVRLYAYEQYQYRSLEEDERRSYIKEVYQLAFRTASQTMRAKRKDTAGIEKAKVPAITSWQGQSFYIAAEEHIALTGKGGQINVSI